MKYEFKTIQDVWAAVDAGLTVYWTSTSNKVFVVDNVGDEKQKNVPCRLYSARNGKILDVRCISNYFGSVISPEFLSGLFVDERELK